MWIGFLLAGLHADRVDVVGGRVERQQDVGDRLAAVLAVEVDLPQDAVHLVVLEQHGVGADQGVLDALAAGELVADGAHQPHLEEHARVDLPGKVLARSAAGQRQQVEVGPQIAGRADLSAGQERLQGHCPAERQAHVRVRRVGHREVHHLLDEAGHLEEVFGDRPGIGDGRAAIGRRRDEVRHEGGDVHAAGAVGRTIAAKSLVPQRAGRLGEVALVFQQGVDGKRRIGVVRLERRRVGGEDVEHPIPQRCAPAPVLARPAPALVVAATHAGPAMALEQGTDITTLVELVARAGRSSPSVRPRSPQRGSPR